MTTTSNPNFQPRFDASTELNYSPRKARLVINTIRGISLPIAMQRLATNSRSKSKKIVHLLRNAANNLNLAPAEYSEYIVGTIVAEEAQRLYRNVPRGRGSAHKIARRYSRIKVTLVPNRSKLQQIMKQMQEDVLSIETDAQTENLETTPMIEAIPATIN